MLRCCLCLRLFLGKDKRVAISKPNTQFSTSKELRNEAIKLKGEVNKLL